MDDGSDVKAHSQEFVDVSFRRPVKVFTHEFVNLSYMFAVAVLDWLRVEFVVKEREPLLLYWAKVLKRLCRQDDSSIFVLRFAGREISLEMFIFYVFKCSTMLPYVQLPNSNFTLDTNWQPTTVPLFILQN